MATTTRQLLVFDEVDVWYQVVARRKLVGEDYCKNWVKNNKSLLSLTNRQVAAQAHQHILVYKTQQESPVSLKNSVGR